jgi:hypothetical protein
MTNLETMTKEQLVALVAQMQKDSARKVTLKVSKRGAISLYGLGRFPVTQYAKGWETIIGLVKDGTLERFIGTNRALLSTGRDDARFAGVRDDE